MIILSGKNRAIIKVHIFIGKCQKIKIQQVYNFQISRENGKKKKALHLNSSKGHCREVINNQSKLNAQNSRVSPNKSNYSNPKLNLTVIKHCQSRLRTVYTNTITSLLWASMYTQKDKTQKYHTHKMEMIILEKYLAISMLYEIL